jgi:hypothetical protein
MNVQLDWRRSLLENFAFAGVLVDQSGVLALQRQRRTGPWRVKGPTTAVLRVMAKR